MRRRRIYNELYLCRECNTHITSQVNYKCHCSVNAPEDEYLQAALFIDASNVYSSTTSRSMDPHKVEDIFCVGCHGRLGWRFIVVSQADVNFIDNGNFLLNMNRLSFVVPPQVTVSNEEEEGEQAAGQVEEGAGLLHELLEGEEEDDVKFLEPGKMEKLEDEQMEDTDQEQEEDEQVVQHDEQAAPQDQEHAGQHHQGEEAAGQDDQEQVRHNQIEQASLPDQHHLALADFINAFQDNSDDAEGEQAAWQDEDHLADADFFNDFPDDFDDNDID